MTKDSYETLHLIKKAKAGDNKSFEILLKGLARYSRWLADKYYFKGADQEDIKQEIRIGIWMAVQDYKPDAGMTWRNFAITKCAHRHLLTQVMMHDRKRDLVLNGALSLEADMNEHINDYKGDKKPLKIDNILASPADDQIKNIIERDYYDMIVTWALAGLTPLEQQAFLFCTISQLGYQEAGEIIGASSKAIDNALLRGLAKLRKKSADLPDDQFRFWFGDQNRPRK